MATPGPNPPEIDTSGRMTADDFDFVSRHPGGFDREFFSSNLIGLLTTYLEAHGLQLEQTQVIVQLDSGFELKTIGAVPALTWVSFQTEDDETWIVPMSAVRRVSFKRRRGEPFRVGFTVQAQADQPTSALAS
jgi:hypothetical protein